MDATQELLDLNQRLLDAIATGDWDTYTELCDPTLSAFEPEARGHLVDGMDFHRFYFSLSEPAGEAQTRPNTTMSQPRVRMLGEHAAIVTCIRLIQCVSPEDQAPKTVCFEETRIWERQERGWQHIHFHRSENG